MKKYIATLLILATVVGISGAPKAQTTTPGLVAAYSFDEGSGLNANDGSGNNLTGTISGATWTSAGKFGNALSFNGTSDWITVADADNLDLTTGMTLEAWVFPTTASGVRDVLIKEGGDVDIYNLYARNWRGVPEGNVHVSGSNRVAEGASLPANTWTHLAVTYDGATVHLFVNGAQVSATGLAGSITTSAGPLRIGGNGIWGEFFQGVIDEVRVYNRALTQSEIQTDMVTPLELAPEGPPPPEPDQVGQWGGVTDWPIVPIHASLLPTGEVLSWDGIAFAPGSATLWNPVTAQFTSVPNGPNIFCAGHISMPDGRVLVLGGHSDFYVGITDTNIYDPFTRTWSAAAPMSFQRWYPTVTALPDGRALVMSGNTDCQTCIADIPEIYDPATNSWSQLSGAQLGIPPYPYNFVLPNGKLLVAGGYHDSMPTRVLDLASQTWQVLDPAPLDAGSAVMYAPGKILKSGSSWETEPAITLSAATTYVLDTDQASPIWRATAPMAFPRVFHTLTVLPDGNVLVTGGSQTTDLFNLGAASLAAEMWSPATETWTTMASAQMPRFYHSVALLLPDGRVLAAGGGRSGVDQLSAEIYSPPYLFKGSRPVISAAPATVQYGANFSVQTPDAARIVKASLIPLGSVTHTFNMNQRFLTLNFQSLSGSLDIQAPANGDVAPPGYYMLFIVDGAGVPSVAALVRLSAPAADVQPPTVSITNPSAGQNVSGTVTVSANAFDNVSVVGVQFKIDGNNLGAEDTTSPYSVSWSATTVANGNHTLTALARDVAGNTAVSAPVTVNVANLVDTTPPNTPTGATATAVSATQVDVAWNASTDNVAVTGYRVFRDGVSVTTVTTTSYSDTGRQPSTTYSYTIAALDGAGNASPQSSPPATATTPATTGPTGLIAAYAFNEGTGTSTVDATGKGHAGTLSNVTWTTAGKYGGGLSFNGTSSWVTVADANDLHLTTGMTVEAWIFPTTNSGVRDILIKEGPNVDIYNLYARNGLGRPESNVFVGGANGTAEGTALPANVWTHITGSYDGATVRLFINGVLTAITGFSGSIATSTGPLRIGGNSLWGEFFEGVIDEVRVYNRALSQSEIQADMNTPVGGTPAPAPSTAPTISPIAPQTTSEDTAMAAIAFTVGDAETAAGSLTLSGGSNNTVLVPNGNITFGGSGANRTVTVTPAANQNGAATITVTVSDGQLSTPTSFTLAVNAVNDAPTITGIANQTTAAGVAVGPLSFVVGDVETAAASLTVSGSSSDMVLVPNGNITFGGSGANRTITVTPATGQTGAATVTMTVSDGQLPTSTSFLLTVSAIPPVPSGLVAAYGFNEASGTSAIDDTGTGHTGTIAGATRTTQGKFGSALSFNGTNSWVAVADADDLDLTTGMTLEAWVFPTAAATTTAWRNVIIKERAGGEVYNLYADTDTHVPAAYVAESASPNSPLGANGTAQVPLNAWTHLAVTYNNSTLSLYVNGSVVRSVATSGALLASTGVLRIGGNSVWGEFFQGMIDEVRIYNRALTQAEIQTDMNTAITP